jgi:pyruvate kinase
VLALTPSLESARRMSLGWGLEPRVANDPSARTTWPAQAVESAVALGFAARGDPVVVVRRRAFGRAAAPTLRIAHAPEAAGAD